MLCMLYSAACLDGSWSLAWLQQQQHVSTRCIHAYMLHIPKSSSLRRGRPWRSQQSVFMLRVWHRADNNAYCPVSYWRFQMTAHNAHLIYEKWDVCFSKCQLVRTNIQGACYLINSLSAETTRKHNVAAMQCLRVWCKHIFIVIYVCVARMPSTRMWAIRML